MAKIDANIPIEQTLFKAADKLRKNIDAGEYKHIVLGLIFLKYISDSFDELYLKLKEGKGDFIDADPEDFDEYKAKNVFFVPKTARWSYLQDNAKQSTIGKLLDDAMLEIERKNQSLKGVLPKVYARPNLDKTALGGLIDLIGTINLKKAEEVSKDILGRIYEYFLGEFALSEGKKGGQFYTPKSIVRLLVEMLQPYQGRVFDPCCGSGGMFVQSEEFVKAHQGRLDDISIYGQESNQTTWRLAKMNLAIRGIDATNIKWNTEGSFLKDAHIDLKSDFVIANPPFNQGDWGGELLATDPRWKYGIPQKNNANFGWVQHFIYHLAPNGRAGFVLSNGSLSAQSGNEGEIRRKIVEDDLVDCIVMMPTQLFYNTAIPACLWFLSRYKSGTRNRSRQGEVLFIDASDMGEMITRRNRVLTDTDVDKITSTYHNWIKGEDYEDIKGFCKSAKLDEIAKHKFVLTPGRYVGIPDEIDDGIPFETKMQGLTSELKGLMKEGNELDAEIKKQLAKVGFEI